MTPPQFLRAILSPAGLVALLFPMLMPWYVAAQDRVEAASDPPALVEVAVVVRDEISSAGQFVATVVPTRRSVVGAAVDGRVESFLYDDQHPDRKLTRVSAGAVLAQLKTDTIERELGTAAAQLTLRQQELNELRNGSRPEEIQIAQAQLRRWQASLEYATARSGRLRKLFEANNSISLDELEEAQSAVVQAEQSCARQQAKYDLAVAGARAEQISQAEARVEAQQQTVHMLEEMLRKYTVRAPFDGYVVDELTEVGAWVSQGDPVAEVIQLVPLEVEACLAGEALVRAANRGDRRVPFDGHAVAILAGARATHYSSSRRSFADISHPYPPGRIRRSGNRPHHGRYVGARGFDGEGGTGRQSLFPKDALVLNANRQTVVVVDRQPLNSDADAMGTARVGTGADGNHSRQPDPDPW